jgi:putative transcriptional regulator
MESAAMQSLQDHFLIAMPAMADPNFTESVTYVCKHDAEGAFGLVITRPSDLSLGEMLGQLAIDLKDRSVADRPVMHGGPVEPQRGFVLHRSEQSFEATLAVSADVKLTSSPDILASIGAGTGPEPALVALGYAGWGRGQLEIELSSNTWLTVPANPTIIFETPFEQRWIAALGLPGVDIRRITQYAGHA